MTLICILMIIAIIITTNIIVTKSIVLYMDGANSSVAYVNAAMARALVMVMMAIVIFYIHTLVGIILSWVVICS